jgi:FdhD protein
VELREEPDVELFRKRLHTSGCGKGVMYASAVEVASRHPLKSELSVPAERILDLIDGLQGRSKLHKRTGGVHSAALSVAGAPPDVDLDDIGRHNAVDKVIGDALLRGLDLSRCVLVNSGRVSSDILHKAKRAGIPVVVSRGAPTHQSVLRAREMGVTLIGFARGRNFNIYSHPDRVG